MNAKFFALVKKLMAHCEREGADEVNAVIEYPKFTTEYEIVIGVRKKKGGA